MEQLLNFFKILGDETRLRIVVLLYYQELCVCQLCGIMNESQPKISKHIAKLRDLGFIKDHRSEQYIFYRLTLDSTLLMDIVRLITTSKDLFPTLLGDLENLKNAQEILKTRGERNERTN